MYRTKDHRRPSTRLRRAVYSWTSIVTGTLVGLAVYGCMATASHPSLSLEDGVVRDHPASQPATSQPARPADLDVQQLTGQVVAGIQAGLSSEIAAAVHATGIGGDATGYNSEFGVGAALVVALALFMTIGLSHRREMERLKRDRTGA